MESKETKDLELNLLVLDWNPEYKKVYEEGFQKEFKDYPNLHTYIIVSNFEEELEKLKGVKLDIVCSSPFFVKHVQYALNGCILYQLVLKTF